VSGIVVATTRESVRAEVVRPLVLEGLGVRTVVDWPGLVAALTSGARLVLVDAEFPGKRAELLHSLVVSLPDGASVRSIAGALPGLPEVPGTERAVLRLAHRLLERRGLSAEERRVLTWQGLGRQPLERLAPIAMSMLPTLIQGERGTGKERIAGVLHRLSGLPGPMLTLTPEGRPELGPEPGTLYAESLHRAPDIKDLVARAAEAGWRFIGGSRREDVPGGVKWERLSLAPLRERPDDLRALATHYLDVHSRRMGLPKRSFDRGMWALLHGHRWPGNHRELEMFVVQVLGRVDASIIRGSALPEEVRAALLPASEAEQEAESFEEMARIRLQPVVKAWARGGDTSLHELVVGSAERALIQLVLARTQGNRKAAAELLGLSRNTLNQRIEGLGIGSVAHRASREEE
jgi:transcriptional regulator of acetoin/glycerol metabolism